MSPRNYESERVQVTPPISGLGRRKKWAESQKGGRKGSKPRGKAKVRRLTEDVEWV